MKSMSDKVLALLVTLMLLVGACREPAPAATATATATATPPAPTPTATPRPTATAVGLPPETGEDVGAVQPGLPRPALANGWTTFPMTRPVTALAQAVDGDIWVGHEAGGFRFPAQAAGEPWTALGGELAEAAVNTFFPLPSGMWVGHDDGASFFDYAGEAWTHLEPAVAPSAGLYRADVQAMAADGEGRLWFGTSGGVTVWDGQRFFYDDFLTVEERFTGRRPHFVYALLYDGENVWAGTERGLFSYDEGYQLTRHDPQALQEGAAAGGASPAVRALALDEDGRLLLGVNRRLLRPEGDGAFTTLFTAEENVREIAVSGGEIWLGLANGRVLRGAGGQWLPAAGPDGGPVSGRHILIDYLGARWFAAEDGGRLSRYVP